MCRGHGLSDLLIIFPLGGKNFHVVHSSADVENAVFQSVRSAFEYQGVLGKTSNPTPSHNLVGQKCSALSRLYVSSSVWNAGGFKDRLLEQVAGIKVGSPTKFGNFMGPVM
jgi:1-pyrroline-5-carboxylate dehydrogenase